MDQLPVDDIRIVHCVLDGPVGGVHKYRTGLPAAEATVAADQLLECRHFVGGLVDLANDHNIADVRKAVVATEVCYGVRSKTGEWIITLDPPGIKVVDSVPADHDRSISLRVHQDEPDAGVIGETG